MKVILLRDVAKIGRRSEIVELPDGYALNQLIPKKWAQPATPENLKKIANTQANTQAHDEAQSVAFVEAVKKLSEQPLQIECDANEQGHLFKAVHEQDIFTAAGARGIALDKSMITIEKPIKSLGQHEVTLKRGKQNASCVIEVIKK